MKKINLVLVTLCICLFYSANILGLTGKESSFADCIIVNFEAEYKYSKAVFVGEVINVKTEGDKKIVEFKVKKYWKGVAEPKIKVDVYESMRFQFPYDVGKTFLVFAKDDENNGLWDQKCSRSKNMNGSSSDLEDDLKALGKGKIFIESKDKN